MIIQVKHETHSNEQSQSFKFVTDNYSTYAKMSKMITSDISNCKYIDRIFHNQLSSFKNSFNFIHLNIHSLQKHFNLLFIFLQSLKFFPELLCLRESRIKDKPLINISILVYCFVHVNFTTAADGVVVYIFNNTKFEENGTQ